VKLIDMTREQLTNYQTRWLKAEQRCQVGSKQWRGCNKRVKKAAKHLARKAK